MDLFAVADHAAAPAALRCYFRAWTGRRFESLGLGDAPDPSPNRITAVDIAAVSMLGVNVPAPRVMIPVYDRTRNVRSSR
jgi:hypothetical protein